MSLVIILLTAIGLSMDAFAVAVATGAAAGTLRIVQVLRVGGSFGFFQMAMPVLGWFLGARLKHVISAADHWIAFALLGLIGLKMMHEACSSSECDRGERSDRPMTNRRLLMLSIATSIDAFAVGMTFAFLNYSVFLPAVVIGLVTFLISGAGVLIGHFCCCIWGKRAEFGGGLLLVLIGLTILYSHLRG